ncbi:MULTISPECIES: hypothetical protein [unclassified Archaeoglobus]|uniref:hypothetical protein n=1 Tax=unclassified Archaeoglobus TaxID=2643606 RepID=UPI0025BB7931|nr:MULTISPECIES: hypothetical protein [unclassified Archaeoglobus]
MYICIIILPLYVLTTVTLTSLFVDISSFLKYVYLCLSTAILISLTFFDRLSEQTKADILPLAFLPIILLISDRTLGYFSPYDIHFCLPLLDRFVEFLIYLKH